MGKSDERLPITSVKDDYDPVDLLMEQIQQTDVPIEMLGKPYQKNHVKSDGEENLSQEDVEAMLDEKIEGVHKHKNEENDEEKMAMLDADIQEVKKDLQESAELAGFQSMSEEENIVQEQRN